MLKLEGTRLDFSFPEVHENAKVQLEFQRTIRIPDDGKNYNLPPSLGRFNVRKVDEPTVKDRVPAKWLEHGGVMMPMYQAEAMWISFNSHAVSGRSSAYPFAIKVSTGMKSALTGETRAAVLKEKDYLVVPPQPWLDGFVVEKGKVRQFVAAPLGMGFTAEEQLSGKAEFGGLQIEVFPMRAEVYEKRFPYVKPDVRRLAYRSRGATGMSIQGMSFDEDEVIYMMSCERGEVASAAMSLNPDMGLGAGGTMSQQVFDDPFDFEDWDRDNKERVFVHLANSLAWQAITGQAPPPPVADAATYARHGYPWYDYYRDDIDSLEATGKLSGLKSILEMGFQKGFHILPENASADVKDSNIHTLTNKATPTDPRQVRDGQWSKAVDDAK